MVPKITDAQLDHIIGLFDGVPFLKDQEISQALMELKQWRKLGREQVGLYKDETNRRDFDNDIEKFKKRMRRVVEIVGEMEQLLASIEGKDG